jgi:hypothetical protein
MANIHEHKHDIIIIQKEGIYSSQHPLKSIELQYNAPPNLYGIKFRPMTTTSHAFNFNLILIGISCPSMFSNFSSRWGVQLAVDHI